LQNGIFLSKPFDLGIFRVLLRIRGQQTPRWGRPESGQNWHEDQAAAGLLLHYNLPTFAESTQSKNLAWMDKMLAVR
jgi:hypothetical protein